MQRSWEYERDAIRQWAHPVPKLGHVMVVRWPGGGEGYYFEQNQAWLEQDLAKAEKQGVIPEAVYCLVK